MPKITVLMPVYNAEKYLREAIDSVITQTFKDYEFLIINDGSNDGSRDIILSYIDSRIRLVDNEHNLGLVKSLNKGLALATGDYIARMDADDISLPLRFERQIDYMEKNKDIVVSGTSIEIIDQNGDSKKTHKVLCGVELEKRYWEPSPMMHPTVIMRHKLVDEGYRYNEEFYEVEDYELWLRIHEKYRLGNLQDVLLKYRMHGANKSLQNLEKVIAQDYAAFLLHTHWNLSCSEYSSVARLSNLISPFQWLRLRYKMTSTFDRIEMRAFLGYTYHWLLNLYQA